MPHIPRIFIAYSRQDLPQLELLRTQLRVLERREFCHIFHDGAIQAGERWDDRIKDELHRADIYLLLVTAEFLDSNYVNDIELPTILQREKEGRAKVFPVILRQCLWKYSELEVFQAILHEGRPIQEKEAYGNVAHIIAEEVARLRAQKDAILNGPQNKLDDLVQKAKEMGDKIEEKAKDKDRTFMDVMNDAQKNDLDKHYDFFEKAKLWADGEKNVFDMCSIKGGSFEMGDVMKDNEYSNETIHHVTLNDFLLSRYPITYAEYDVFCSNTNRKLPNDWGHRRGKRPVTNVSWMDAVEYCNRRSLEEDLNQVYQIRTNHVTADWSQNGYRLPTEAEWEYAARDGGKTTRFGNGKPIADPQEINFDGRKLFQKDYSIVGFFRAQTIEVGSLTCPNKMGLHDMSGNIWEWCWDWYGDYSRKPQINPKGPDEGLFHVYRGGSWDVDASFARVSYRPESLPANDFFNIGFRIARSASI